MDSKIVSPFFSFLYSESTTGKARLPTSLRRKGLDNFPKISGSNYTPILSRLCITDSNCSTGELAHLEMIGAIVYQLTKDLSIEEIKKAGFDAYFVDHTTGIYPAAANGTPYNAFSMAVKGDVLTDLHENLAAEQKARTTYDNILRFCDDPDVIDPIRFLREREVVHYQRFGEGLRIATDKLDSKNFYAFNPSFDKNCKKK